ncbi:hypothetical protein [Rhodococcus sp. USK13]|uniref:hypothetical protein n=1 Tax=Rhodococcus sp. USK13 TaxID=2806442 RepID=UPI001BCC82F3|nr:hypothetical protein [Rhodococcus sp. USK13]
MSPARSDATATLRGAAVGALSAGLAVAAHGAGGGGFPASAALTLLLLACSGVGAITANLPPRFHSNSALLGALGFGQVAGHLTLAATAHVHAVLPAAPMLLAHAAATVVCALLIASAEQLYRSLVHVWRVVLRGEPRPVAVAAALPHPVPRRNPVDALLRASISRRGPPVLV